MTSRTKGRIALIVAGIVAVLVAATSVWQPAHWAIAVAGSYLRSSAPPPILGDVRCTDLPKCTKATAAFNAIVRRRFPIGSSVKAMEATLTAQDFAAPTADAQFLSYGWGHLPCSHGLKVSWTDDGHGAIKTIDGLYFYGCQ
jgi:hypothetical protein